MLLLLDLDADTRATIAAWLLVVVPSLSCQQDEPAGDGEASGTEAAEMDDSGEPGASCTQVFGCSTGSVCAAGTCVACGTGQAEPGKVCLSEEVRIATPGARELQRVVLDGKPAVHVLRSHEVHFRFLLPDFTGGFVVTWVVGGVEHADARMLDLDGDGVDDLVMCGSHQSGCTVAQIVGDSLVPLGTYHGPATGIPSSSDLPGRVFDRHDDGYRWKWVYPAGLVDGGELPVPADDPPTAIDVDGDGTLELVVIGDDTLFVLRPNETGIGLDVVDTLAVPEHSAIERTAQLDDDPGLELLLDIGASRLMRVDFDDGPVITEPFPSLERQSDVAVGDIDGDGRPDLVFASNGVTEPMDGPVPDRDRLEFLLQTSPGTFERVTRFPEHLPRTMLVADLDGDGDRDLLAADYDAVFLFDNDP